MASGTVYVASRGLLGAIDTVKREETWRFTANMDGSSYPVIPVVSNGVLYINGADGKPYALGAGVPKLSVGGTARVTETTSLRGGPSLTVVQRTQLDPDTVVIITDESKTTGDVVWRPVKVEGTGKEGWVDASTLEPQANGSEPTPET